MNDTKYIGLDVHQATITAAVRDASGNLVMEAILETKAETILQFFRGLRGSLHVIFEEGSGEYRFEGRQLRRSEKVLAIRGLNRNHNRDLKNIFKGAAIWAAGNTGPFQNFYEACLARGLKPHLERLTLARKIAAITLLVWKKGVCFDANHLTQQAA